MTPIRFNREFEFRYGVVERLMPLVRRVVARNPGFGGRKKPRVKPQRDEKRTNPGPRFG